MEIQLIVKTKIIKFSVNPRTWAEEEKIEEVKSFKFWWKGQRKKCLYAKCVIYGEVENDRTWSILLGEMVFTFTSNNCREILIR